jgi:hypothetical protein
MLTYISASIIGTEEKKTEDRLQALDFRHRYDRCDFSPATKLYPEPEP